MENKYFGGTNITLEKLKAIMPTINVDGTTYNIENWFAECDVFEKLVPNKSKVWVPYGGAEDWGILKEVVYDKYEFSNYSFPDECNDWWVSVPYLIVELNGINYYVYEISIYNRMVKRKSQIHELNRRRLEPKRKFLSKQDIIEFKKQEIINNRNRNK